LLELSFIGDYNNLNSGVRRASSSVQKVTVKNCSSKRSIPSDRREKENKDSNHQYESGVSHSVTSLPPVAMLHVEYNEPK
jgi:hypothetical protein